MKTSIASLMFGMAAMLLSCGSNHNPNAESANYKMAMADSVAVPDSRALAEEVYTAPPSSSAAVVNPNDSTHKFVRTADLKFKVKNVYNATQTIENITSQMGGFVTYTSLNSNIDNQTTTAVSADSSLITTYYTVNNDITLRVPNTALDTTLRAIASLIDFLDYRTIKADDVALQLLANKMAKNRMARTEQRLTNAIDNKGKKLGEITDAEESLSDRQEQGDNATISNLSLQDQVSFSTVHLSIYQRQSIKREVVPNDKNISAYAPGIGYQLLDALKTGWSILKSIFVFIANSWAVILIIVVCILLYKRHKNKSKKR